MGFNRHIPTEIRFGPKIYNRKGLVDLELHQFAQHIDRLTGYLRQDNEVGKLLSIQLETHQMLIGSEQFFLHLNPDIYSYGEPSWSQFLWEQCHKFGVTLHFKALWKETIARENDRFIMDKIVKQIQKSYVLKRLNDIRLYLKVSRVSDITNAEGNAIRQDIFDGIPNGNSELDWPKRRKPIAQNVATWKRVIIELFKSSMGIYPKKRSNST